MLQQTMAERSSRARCAADTIAVDDDTMRRRCMEDGGRWTGGPGKLSILLCSRLSVRFPSVGSFKRVFFPHPPAACGRLPLFFVCPTMANSEPSSTIWGWLQWCDVPNLLVLLIFTIGFLYQHDLFSLPQRKARRARHHLSRNNNSSSSSQWRKLEVSITPIFERLNIIIRHRLKWFAHQDEQRIQASEATLFSCRHYGLMRRFPELEEDQLLHVHFQIFLYESLPQLYISLRWYQQIVDLLTDSEFLSKRLQVLGTRQGVELFVADCRLLGEASQQALWNLPSGFWESSHTAIVEYLIECQEWNIHHAEALGSDANAHQDSWVDLGRAWYLLGESLLPLAPLTALDYLYRAQKIQTKLVRQCQWNVAQGLENVARLCQVQGLALYEHFATCSKLRENIQNPLFLVSAMELDYQYHPEICRLSRRNKVLQRHSAKLQRHLKRAYQTCRALKDAQAAICGIWCPPDELELWILLEMILSEWSAL
jgi:hypothetical protein